jgi:hypothetical protein
MRGRSREVCFKSWGCKTLETSRGRHPWRAGGRQPSPLFEERTRKVHSKVLGDDSDNKDKMLIFSNLKLKHALTPKYGTLIEWYLVR